MKLHYLKKANRSTEVLRQTKKISYWQLIALQSRANGCFYQFEKLPQIKWQWPTGTWFQERLVKNTGMACLRHSDRMIT
jgi:hypothetical protein